MAPASRWCAAAVIVAAMLSAGSASAAGQCRAPETLTSFGTWFEPNTELTAEVADRPIHANIWVSNAETMRLQLQVRAGGDRHWHLLVRDEDYRVLATFYPEDFTAQDGTLSLSRWTGRLPTASVRVDLRADAHSDLRVAVIGGIAMTAPRVPNEKQFSTQHAEPAWKDLYDSTRIPVRRAGDAVGMLLGGSFNSLTGTQDSWCCSGVMVGKTLMLTNWHCGGVAGTRPESFWNEAACANTIFDLGWDSGKVSQQYACVGIVAKDQSLDFALIRVRPVLGAGAGSEHAPFALIRQGTLPDAVFVVHHAICQPKLFSGGCRIKTQAYRNWIDPGVSTDFTHDCDTEHGSSGAPVFDEAGQLVGLHHLGFDCAPPDKVNKAVPISRIIDFLRANNPAAAAELGSP